ncbi:hypothetical protein [Salinibacterium xinjiangense]|uniref:hypothetical protein n=1 Tax=Salinibacterium xinjiangense TaxID=386302 RepID=UPI00117AA449|nr:hypothetical protein [Salinibacterium xinjiangense]
MMVRFWGARSAIADAVFAIVAVAVIATGIVVTSELRFADAAGQPLDVPAVSITPSPVPGAEPAAEPNVKPSPKPSQEPTATPTSPPTSSSAPGDDEPGVVTGPLSGDDEPEVVTAPPPVEVELDNHDGLSNDDSSGDSSGASNPED